ncbi:MAG: GNAT family N-acetyltransferase [Candidatus Eisenbacteria sp.]|nr:GNAT family N-acetyltransferase [Candidatus Eisenbacteria bacterium]
MTRPEFQNRGLATFLIKESINALLDQGHAALYLVVTEGKVAAQHLYEKVGFHKIVPSRRSHE